MPGDDSLLGSVKLAGHLLVVDEFVDVAVHVGYPAHTVFLKMSIFVS